MIKASELMGRAITVREGGHEAGRVRDLIVDQPGKRVLGFVVAEGLLKRTKVASWGAVLAIGPDAIVLDARTSIVRASDAGDMKTQLDSKAKIRGLRLQTTEGKDLGRIDDFYFNELTGEVEGYEISGGLVADTFAGRSFLPSPDSIELGKDVAFIAPDVEAALRQTDRGSRAGLKKPEEQRAE